MFMLCLVGKKKMFLYIYFIFKKFMGEVKVLSWLGIFVDLNVDYSIL